MFSPILFSLCEAAKKQFLQMVYFVFPVKIHEENFFNISKHLDANLLTFLQGFFLWWEWISSENVAYNFIITDHFCMTD